MLTIFPNSSYFMLDAEPRHRDWAGLLRRPNVGGASAVLDAEAHKVEWFKPKRADVPDTGHTRYRETTGYFEEVVMEVRHAETLDGVLAANGRSHVVFDLIKLDVQGAELDAMRGGSQALSRASIVTLEMPFFGEYNQGSPTFAQYVSFMEAAGFVPFDMIEEHRLGFGKSGYRALIQVDFIFVRRSSTYFEQFQHSLRQRGSTHPRYRS